MANQENKEDGKSAVRTKDDYLHLSRFIIQNHLRTEKTKRPEAKQLLQTEKKKSGIKKVLFTITYFLTRNFIPWIYYYFDSRFGRKHAYPEYTTPKGGVHQLEKSHHSGKDYISLAIAGDWGTNTAESEKIAAEMGKHQPDYTIHIGDTYFVGAPHEIRNNFTAPDSPWVRGEVGSFSLLGNHEMYARGDAFFDLQLPSMGLKKDGIYTGQEAGFFCLENEHWRILGLDTGYHSIGIPIIEMIWSPDSRFDKKLMRWLKETVRLDDKNDKRGLLILTHHQYISAFKGETEYMKPAAQLASLIGKDRPVVWIWGHEHKFSMYGKAQVGSGITAYGRCIGHGGMPTELSSFKKSAKKHGSSKLVMYDSRPWKTLDNARLGFNGYCLLKVAGAAVKIEYYDINGFLFSEEWTADGSGKINGTINPPAPVTSLSHEYGKTWEDVVSDK